MASLAETNPYLKDRKKMVEMIAEDVYESAIFEGASPRSLKDIHGQRPSRRPKRRAEETDNSPQSSQP